MDAERAEREDVVVRQYRFLLRTAPADALEMAHVEALSGLGRSRGRAPGSPLTQGLRRARNHRRDTSRNMRVASRAMRTLELSA